MALQKLTLTIRKGSAENIPIRLEQSAWSYATISAVSQTAPLRISAPAHGIPDGWRVAIMNVKSVGDFGATNNHIRAGDLLSRLVPAQCVDDDGPAMRSLPLPQVSYWCQHEPPPSSAV